MPDIRTEWVTDIPEKVRTSPYDEYAEQVRSKPGKVLRIESTPGSLHTLANRLRFRYPDLKITARTTDDGCFVYMKKEKK